MNKIQWFIAFYLFILATSLSAALPVSSLSFDTFNQSVNAGTEIALGIQYGKQKSYQLAEGDQPASKTGWESHSTLTTGLFPLMAGEKAHLSYVAKADGKDKQLPVLWTEVRYFDQHGVNINVTGGRRQVVSSQWRNNMIRLAPHKSGVAYAEVWFVKYADGRSYDEAERNNNEADNENYVSAIYLSDIKLK